MIGGFLCVVTLKIEAKGDCLKARVLAYFMGRLVEILEGVESTETLLSGQGFRLYTLKNEVIEVIDMIEFWITMVVVD